MALNPYLLASNNIVAENKVIAKVYFRLKAVYIGR